MGRNRFWSVVFSLMLALAGGAVVYELWDSPPPSTASVDASVPNRPDELARLDGGFKWTATREGSPLFELLAASGIVVEGGVEFLREIDSLRLHLKDGGWVTLHAPAGRIEGRGEEGKSLRLFLEGGVTAEDPSGSTLSSESLTYDFSTNRLTASGPAQVTRVDARMTMEAFEYDTTTKRLVTQGAVQMELGLGGNYRLETTDAIYQLESGDVVFTHPVRIRGLAEPFEIIAWRGGAQLSKSGRGDSLKLEGPLLIDARSPRGMWKIAGLRLVTEPGAKLAVLAIDGPAVCLLESSSSSGPQRGVLRTNALRVEPTPNDGYLAVASNGFEAELSSDDSASDGVQISGGEARLIAPGRVVATMTASDHVTVKARDGATAEGTALEWNVSAPQLVVLEGVPARALQKRDSVEAPRLIFDRKLRVLLAQGPVTTQIVSASSSSGAIFRGGEPLTIRSQQVSMPQNEGWTVFTGPVQAWQETARLRSETLRYDRQNEKLEASGNVSITRSLPAEDGTIHIVRLDAQSLIYGAMQREVRLEGGARYQEEPGMRLTAASMLVHLGEQESVDSLTATGDVKIDARGTRGSADRLEWTGGGKGVAILFGTKSFATLQTTDGPPMRGQRLRYDLKTQQFTADGGSGKTVMEGTTSPPGEKKP